MKATEKQIGYVLFLAGKMGYRASDRIDSRLGRAMGLSMRARSWASSLIEYLRGLDTREISDVIDSIK